jgi:ABC-type nickel/cobalt efflux system permease component RcnA
VKWLQRISIAILAVIALAVIAFAVDDVYTAVQRKRQKQTMANIRDAATRHEAGAPIGKLVDEWGTPMQIRIRGSHYAIRAAMSDRIFEPGLPRRMTYKFSDDVVFIDGNFRQFPYGI